ncbi:MAG: hypothetical protein R3338_10215 [Thermoanaerobaculia bacterium]|nr:hypothetical protein [Thermoanaerobaculia bacterium]
MRQITSAFGIAFLILAGLYFIRPGVWGTHLTGTHTLIHLVTGIIAVWVGTRSSMKVISIVTLVLGLCYLGLGVAGFAVGSWGLPSAGVPGPGNSKMWLVVPGIIELGLRDHVVHLVAGAAFIVAMALSLFSAGDTATPNPAE